MLKSVRASIALVAGALALSSLSSVYAADYPAKPVTVVVSFSAGGPVDSLMRALGQRLTEEWKQPVVIDNRPGANEAIGAQVVAKAPADGYTLFASTEGPLTQNQYLYKKLPYNPNKDFTAVTQLVQVPMVLVTPINFPANSLKEFLDLARSRASKPISYGSTGMGGVTHLPMSMLAKDTNIAFVHVPYKGAAPLLPEIVSGQIDSAFLAVSAAAPFIADKKLKALVISAPQRIPSLSQVPTFKELGVEDVQATFIMALTAPTGTPQPIVDKIAASVQKIMADPKFREKYTEPFAYLPVASSPKDFAVYLAKDRGYQAERVKISGVVLD